MKTLSRVLLLLVAVGLVVALVFGERLVQLRRVATLFDEDRIVHNFQNMDQVFPTEAIERGGTVHEFERVPWELPASFEHRGQRRDTEAFVRDHVVTGMLVLHDDEIRVERYHHGHSADGTHIAWSVSKSVLSALFGIAVEEGHVADIHQAVTEYVPELAGSGYDGVSIKNVLQMSSGVGFDEDYGDPDSDINRMGTALATGSSMLEFAGTLERVRDPGTVQHYVSIDTLVLGIVLERATGRSLSQYTSLKLWKPLGMESDAYWMTDGTGSGMAFGGLNASLRDFARFGRLYLHRGNWNGVQVVPEEWVASSTTPDAPHLMPSSEPGNERMGYGYQWWLPEDWDDDFIALGIYDQMIYVDPKNDLVVALQSANPAFQDDDFESGRVALSLFRAIAAKLRAEST